MTPLVQAVQRARPSVVNIRGEKTLDETDLAVGPAGNGRRVNGMGTGVVIDPRGYIVTNYHVVDGVRQIQVTLADGTQVAARLVDNDPETDLAIIKIDLPSELPVIPVGTSSDLMPGETVVAVGNAYGYEHTVTRGIISALHRAVQVSDAQFYDDLIQTDASINPGNSGGPLLNIDGEMIGINVAVRAGAQGIGFAIPTDKAIAVTARLLASSKAQGAWHGVRLAGTATADGGVTVGSVEAKSPAADCGLRPGDVILSVDGVETGRDLDFSRAMLEFDAGAEVSLSIRRDGEPMTLQLTMVGLQDRLKAMPDPAWELFGMQLKVIPSKQFRETYRTRYRGGLAVTDVRPGSPAAHRGIRSGDVLVGMHVWETVSVDNIAYIVNRPDFSGLSPIKFFILRGNETLYGYLPVATKTARRP
ncbi:MAG: trypsin-like peptidase domain-containing protein [Pirellulales bacterium]|nr:trypsin-like peptidase domain-containing protein [Pirellulales bacterium]